MERGFEFCYERDNTNTRYVLDGNGEKIKLREDARLPELSTSKAAAYDFFAAETVVIPPTIGSVVNNKPVLVKTGIKVSMSDDEVFIIANRSGNPGKRGLVLANGIGIIDADYYDIEGEICFNFFNFSDGNVEVSAGDKIGQGFFLDIKRAVYGFTDNSVIRTGGFGSTGF